MSIYSIYFVSGAIVVVVVVVDTARASEETCRTQYHLFAAVTGCLCTFFVVVYCYPNAELLVGWFYIDIITNIKTTCVFMNNLELWKRLNALDFVRL